MEELGLERFILKQEEYYELALKEINNGRKVSCWMWYIFPQITGLGKSPVAKIYSIKNIEEAKEYLSNEKLKHNLLEITQALLNLGDVNITRVMGYIDDIKLKSCMTLFDVVEQEYNINCGKIFQKVLHQFFNDEKDEMTLKILEEQKNLEKNEEKEESEENEENKENNKNELNEEKNIDKTEVKNDENEKENKNAKIIFDKLKDNQQTKEIKEYNKNFDEREVLKGRAKKRHLIISSNNLEEKQKIRESNIPYINNNSENKKELNENENIDNEPNYSSNTIKLQKNESHRDSCCNDCNII